MSADTRLILVRKEGVNRTEIGDLLDDGEDGDVQWLGDQSFALLKNVRFYEFEQSDPERRIRLALETIPLELFERIEPFVVACPDVQTYSAVDTLQSVLRAEDTIRIDFHDYVPGDERLDEAAQDEARQMLKSVNALVAFSRYQVQDAVFAADIARLSGEGKLEALVIRTRAVATLAPVVDTLIAAKHFESCIDAAKYGRR